MRLETFKWLYQRVSTPFILILFFWLVYNAFNIEDYKYQTINLFFESSINLFLFVIFILLSLLHTSIEVFHSISDYFTKTKNEKNIILFVKVLYFLIFLSLIIFILKFVL